jgi:hypothetical protein
MSWPFEIQGPAPANSVSPSTAECPLQEANSRLSRTGPGLQLGYFWNTPVAIIGKARGDTVGTDVLIQPGEEVNIESTVVYVRAPQLERPIRSPRNSAGLHGRGLEVPSIAKRDIRDR